VSVYARNAKVAAYQSVSTHGEVAGADPHRLVLMLMDGAVERLAIARGCLARKQRGDIARKSQALTQCMRIVGELRGTLNLEQGGALAHNLSDLYDYMLRQLLRANAENNADCIGEVTGLLGEIRSAWIAIGPEVRRQGSVGPAHAAAR
jgi:flagellar secretion chaperone FliS